jgi:hypothetical protein
MALLAAPRPTVGPAARAHAVAVLLTFLAVVLVVVLISFVAGAAGALDWPTPSGVSPLLPSPVPGPVPEPVPGG